MIRGYLGNILTPHHPVIARRASARRTDFLHTLDSVSLYQTLTSQLEGYLLAQASSEAWGMRILTVAAVSACLLSGAATAQDATGWNGFYAGVLASGTAGEMFNASGSSFSIRGSTVSALAGYRVPVSGGVAGIEGQVNLGGTGLSDRIPFGGSGGIDYSYDARTSLALTGSFGVPMDNILPFALAGASIGTGAYDEHITTGPGFPPLINPDLYMDAVHLGLVLGAGVDVHLTDHLLLRGQYTFTNMIKASYSDPSFGSFKLGSHIHSLGAGLIYRF